MAMQTQRTPIQTSIDRATARALEQARLGNLPTLISSDADAAQTWQVWSVSSRTTDGSIYVVDLYADIDGLRTICSCEAGKASRICWHRAASRLACLGDIPHFEAAEAATLETASDDASHWAAVA